MLLGNFSIISKIEFLIVSIRLLLILSKIKGKLIRRVDNNFAIISPDLSTLHISSSNFLANSVINFISLL